MKHNFFATAQQEYAGRIHSFCQFQIIEISEEKLTKNININSVKKKEAQRFREKIPSNALVVALDEQEKEKTAQEFSEFLEHIELLHKPIVFLIGGANGLSKELVQSADFTLSLGKMTLTQDLARIVFLETLFRGFSIQKGLPFHR